MIRSLTIVACLVGLLLATTARAAQPRTDVGFRTERPYKAVVVGGSISLYYAGNFGQYLQFGCKDLEVIHRGKVGAGGHVLAQILRDQVIGDKALMKHLADGKGWILFQGGLNSVGSPESTAWQLSRLFLAAHQAGLKVLALSLTPWGSAADPRFEGWKGLRILRATEQVVDFVLGRLTPKQALGKRAADRADDKWLPGELPAIAVDLLQSPLRAGKAAGLRDRAELERTFAASPYKKQAGQKAVLVAAAQAVPQFFMHTKFHDFDHVHPNSAGHRLIAALACQQAPAEWGCDCDAIRRAEWKGKVVAGR